LFSAADDVSSADLKNSYSGLTAIMENSSDLPAAQKENVAGIRSSAEDLQRIITDVLDLSKLENGSMQIETISFDLREVAEASLDSMAHLAHAKDLELLLTCTVDEDPPKLLGDPFRIKQW
jgi:signal transduction histidine kinase